MLIIGILAAIALPQYQTAVERSRAAEGMLTVKALAQAGAVFCLERGQTPNWAKWNEFGLSYDTTNTDDSASTRKTIGQFNCFFNGQEVSCARTNDLFTLAQKADCSANKSRTCSAPGGINDKGARVCKGLGFKCDQQCKQVCMYPSCPPCQQICPPPVCTPGDPINGTLGYCMEQPCTQYCPSCPPPRCDQICDSVLCTE